MPFDAEVSVRAAHLLCAIPQSDPKTDLKTDLGETVAVAADPCPSMARTDPAALLAFLFVSPRPCAALDALLES